MSNRESMSFILDEPMYGYSLLFLVDCDHETAAKKAKKRWGADVNFRATNGSVAYVPENPGFMICFIRYADDVNTVAHEILHIALMILGNASVPVDCDKNQEAACYLNGWLHEAYLKRLTRERKRRKTAKS